MGSISAVPVENITPSFIGGFSSGISQTFSEESASDTAFGHFSAGIAGSIWSTLRLQFAPRTL